MQAKPIPYFRHMFDTESRAFSSREEALKVISFYKKQKYPLVYIREKRTVKVYAGLSIAAIRFDGPINENVNL